MRNVLSMSQIINLSDFVKRNQEKLESDTKFAQKAHSAASKELNFTITRRNFKSVVDSCGINMAERCVDMKKTPKNNNERLRVLAKAIRELYKDLGKEVPDGINNMIRNQAVTDNEPTA